MKKHILISLGLLAASSMASAGGLVVGSVSADSAYKVCDGGANGGKAAVNGGSGAIVATAIFTRTGFDLQCSANVFLSVNEVSSNLALVGAGSAKGNQYFGGHSNGGAIGTLGKCTGTNNACTDTDVNSALTAAKTKSSATGT